MKKNIFLAMAACMMLFTACSSQDEPIVSGDDTAKHEVELTFDFTVSAGTESRAGRPLYSEEALQQVNNLQLYIFNDGKYVETLEITSFNNKKPSESESHVHTFNSQLENGTYTFLAIGFEENPQATYKLPTFTTGTTTIADVTLAFAEGKTEGVEVFSGVSKEYEITNETKGLKASVELHRVVAGVLAYFENIPYEVEHNDDFVKVTRLAVEICGKGTVADVKERTVKDQINTKYDLFSFSTQGMKIDKDKNIYTCEAVKTDSYTKVANSVLAGKFILPFDNESTDATFKVVLYAEVGNTEVQVKEYNVTCATEGHTDNKSFNIFANHYYGLGKKLKANNGGEDPDKPIDLSRDEIIIISVDADWETIHDLELE